MLLLQEEGHHHGPRSGLIISPYQLTRAYFDDAMNTDNAWIEVCAGSLHDSNDDMLLTFKVRCFPKVAGCYLGFPPAYTAQYLYLRPTRLKGLRVHLKFVDFEVLFGHDIGWDVLR